MSNFTSVSCLASAILIAGLCGCAETIDAETPARVADDAPRSSDFDVEGDKQPLQIFEPEPNTDDGSSASIGKTDPFEDLSIGVNSDDETVAEAAAKPATATTIEAKQADVDSEPSNEKQHVVENQQPLIGIQESADSSEFDETAFFEGTARQRSRLSELQDEMAPELHVSDWTNSEPMTLDDLKGKIVVIDFWATWCGPCLKSVPHNNDLAMKYANDVVFIGVCAKRGAEKMSSTVNKYDIAYPVAIDTNAQTVSDYKANGYPDYFIIDRTGKIRIADCRNSSVEAAIEGLLAEGS